MAGIRIWSTLVAISGRAEVMELLFWKGIFEILTKTLTPSLDSVPLIKSYHRDVHTRIYSLLNSKS